MLVAGTWKSEEPTSGLKNRLPIGSSYEFACARSRLSLCVRQIGLSVGFLAAQRQSSVRCVPACTSLVAVRLQYVEEAVLLFSFSA